MKIALICPSNMLYMPYVSNYESILKRNKIEYDIINWDRFNIEDKDNHLRYRDLKIGHQRSFLDYYKYRKFIINHLKVTQYDKIIVFGLQLIYFLKGLLNKKYKGQYIIDIRDRNKIIDFFNISKSIKNSTFTVISSAGYKEWLPKSSDKYIINHNTQLSSISELNKVNQIQDKERINIAYVGAIRDYQINIDFINCLKNNNRINLYFHGEGDINKKIQMYLEDNKIRNVYLTGRYKKENEKDLYMNNNLINVLRYNDGINNKTALPNRLYNATIYGKPLVAFEGTHLGEDISKYNLGIVVDSFERVGEKIIQYLDNFDQERYEEGRRCFLNKVIKENNNFENKIEEFIRL
ncbi:hypothetical protein IFR10_05145 [Bacillus sp. CFBP 13597]|nr:hypothetical protein [Bacillus sp. CFBP 13597]